MDVTSDKLITTYLKIRDARKTAKEEFAAVDKKMKLQQDRVGNELMRRLKEQNIDQIKSVDGTVFTKENTFINVKDKDAWYAWCLKNNMEELLDIRASTAALQEYLKKHNDVLPDGISVFRELSLQIRTNNKR